jgi:hypothetical protein
VIDIIVPTIPGREESLDRCLDSFERNTSVELNHRIISDSPTCGEGWMIGLEDSTAPYVLLVADDIECASENWAEVCMETTDEGLLPCPRVWTPDGSIESQGGDMNAYGHILARHRKDGSPTDFTTVPFMSREQADRIGGFGGQYGCDVYVSYRGRQLGYETVLRHGFDLVHHQHPVGRGAGMNQNDRDAMDMEIMRRELAQYE